MSTNYRALCAEMLSGWQEGGDIAGPMNRARAALKTEPEGSTNPSGYAYRYRDYSGGTYIKFNGGEEVNGSRPIEAVPYWFAPPSVPTAPPTPETKASATSPHSVEGDALLEAFCQSAIRTTPPAPQAGEVGEEQEGDDALPPIYRAANVPFERFIYLLQRDALHVRSNALAPIFAQSADRIDRAIALLQQQATELAALRGVPVAVAVSEQLPDEKAYHPEVGWCWGYRYGRWTMMEESCFAPPKEHVEATHWLPYNALPLPAPQAGEAQP